MGVVHEAVADRGHISGSTREKCYHENHQDDAAAIVPQLAAANAENGCHEGIRQGQGGCLLPTLEELTVLYAPCVDGWSPGNIPEGGACLYGAFGCAAPDRPGVRAVCAFESSFDVGGGASSRATASSR